MTNEFILREKSKYVHQDRIRETDDVEIKALLGLFILFGIYHSNRLNLGDIWNNDGTGIETFRLTMSLQRFRFLRCLRFDSKETKSERRKIDKLER